METKIVYVVVSDEKDIYLEQFFVSVASLRKNSPGAYVILLTDQFTAFGFLGNRKKFSEAADEIKIVEMPSGLSAQARSRLLKTSVRNQVQGNFLFIDCDTLILRPLNEIDNCKAQLAACLDSHSSLKENPYKKMIFYHGKRIDFEFDEERDYFNSGVIFVKDTPLAHEFYNSWQKQWKEGFEKGVSMDQPAFNKTNYMLGFPLEILPDIWNCELKHGLRYLKNPIILHYLCTNVNTPEDPQVYIMNNKDFLMKIKESGVICPEIEECFDDHFKGFLTNTQINSGQDLYLYQTLSYQLIKNIHNKRSGNFFEFIVKVLLKLRNLLK